MLAVDRIPRFTQPWLIFIYALPPCHIKCSSLVFFIHFHGSMGPRMTYFLLFYLLQSVNPSRPLPSLTMWVEQLESYPSRRGHPYCFTSGLQMTGGKVGTMALTDSSPISTSWSKTRMLASYPFLCAWPHCWVEILLLESLENGGEQLHWAPK